MLDEAVLNIPKYWKKDWFVGAVVTLLFLILAVSNKLRDLDWWAYDIGVRFTAERAAVTKAAMSAVSSAGP